MSQQPRRYGSTITQGGLLPREMLTRIQSVDKSLSGLTPESYQLDSHIQIGEAVNYSWNRAIAAWGGFLREHGSEPQRAGPTREQWLLPLFKELGYSELQRARSIDIEGTNFAVSHMWKHSPIHLLGTDTDLDTKRSGVAGAARTSPHGLVQELLNRSNSHLWGFVSNGHFLRVLRDHRSLTRRSYIEFDLRAIMDGEQFSEFFLLWLICHRSRVESDDPNKCWLEHWHQASQLEGVRALGRLRTSTERAIEVLGKGFLSNPKNTKLHASLSEGRLDKQEYYRQILRLIYRMIFLSVAEEREVLHSPGSSQSEMNRYFRFYSMSRLRNLSRKRRGGSHGDLWDSLRIVMEHLDDGCARIALPALGSALWSSNRDTGQPDEGCPWIMNLECSNEHLLEAVYHLSNTQDGNVTFPINWRNIGYEELGSVYESLLELHPKINLEAGTFSIASESGSERKTTGSYFTPSDLVSSMLNQCLDPIIRHACKGPDPENTLLNLKICDPACGSGHFLVAAARRVSEHLAILRSGGEEPSPKEIQAALRDVTSKCVYGVDINPMSVELCKISLWMEAVDPGRPLSFLEHHIHVGNSLVGIVDPNIMEGGIPDAAYKPIEPDDPAICKALKKNNVKGDYVQVGIFEDSTQDEIPTAISGVNNLSDSNRKDVEQKHKAWREFLDGDTHRREKLRADLFSSAFLTEKNSSTFESVPLSEDLGRVRRSMTMRPGVAELSQGLADRHMYFHWHITFADVLQDGGFDAVITNPPWERIELKEQEFFAKFRPDIANSENTSRRSRLINKLASSDSPDEDKALHKRYICARRTAKAISAFASESKRYPLASTGYLNTYPLFSELGMQLTNPQGRAGLIVPTGIAIDKGKSKFFSEIFKSGRLVSLYDFENGPKFFKDVATGIRFCLLTLGRRESADPEFAFFLKDIAEIDDADRRVTLSISDVEIINPNTLTVPTFRTSADATIVKKIYRCAGVLINESAGPPGNPWKVRFKQMLNMSTDNDLFVHDSQLSGTIEKAGSTWKHDEEDQMWLPVYEGKMINQYDYRWATWVNGHTQRVSETDKADPNYVTAPRYWILRSEVNNQLNEDDRNRLWLIGWRDVTSATAERTAIATVLPYVGAGHTLPVLFLGSDIPNRLWACFLANFNSLPFDYVVRQKISGLHLSFFHLNQLPLLPPKLFGKSEINFIVPRVVQLIYTTEAMRAFASDLGMFREPFVWDLNCRATLIAELDAAFAYLYGLSRDELRFILDPSDMRGDAFPSETFRKMKEYELDRFGVYRTRDLTLKAWDRYFA